MSKGDLVLEPAGRHVLVFVLSLRLLFRDRPTPPLALVRRLVLLRPV